MESELNLKLCLFEIKKITKKINNLTYHAQRCKQVNDKIKLITMITANSVYASSLLIEAKKELSKIKDSIFINL